MKKTAESLAVLLHSLMERDVAQLVSARVWGA